MKYISRIILLLSISLSVPSQTIKEKSESEILELLCHKWQTMSVEMMDKKVPMPPERQGYMKFEKGGVLKMISMEETNSIKWRYDHSLKTVYMIEPEQIKDSPLQIIKITADELVLQDISEALPMNIYLKRADK